MCVRMCWPALECVVQCMRAYYVGTDVSAVFVLTPRQSPLIDETQTSC